jgi:hypothetical protein
MTGSTNHDRQPGEFLLKLSRLIFDEQTLALVVQPTIADLQREIERAGGKPAERLRARWRGYFAFWRVVLVALVSPRAEAAPRTLESGAIAVPDAIARVAVVSIAVVVVAIVGPIIGGWLALVAAAGAVAAILLHAWYDRHPTILPTPDEPDRKAPQINFSSTEVPGNIGGLIFVVGSVFIVALAMPSVVWFLCGALVGGGLLGWALLAWHASHPHRGVPGRPIVLR